MRQHLNAPGAVDVAKGSRGQHSKSKLVLRNHHWRHSFCGLSKARQQLPVGAPVVHAQLPEALQRVRGHYEQDSLRWYLRAGPLLSLCRSFQVRHQTLAAYDSFKLS